MNNLKSLKEFLIKTAPGYEKLDPNASLTSKMMYSHRIVSFTRAFYPGTHIEGDSGVWYRRFKVGINRTIRYFGPRNELLWIFAFLYFWRRMAVNNLLREDIEKEFLDRNVYHTVNLPLSSRRILQ